MSEARRRIRASRDQEARAARDFGGVRNPGSGNGARKGDVRVSGSSWRDPDHQLIEFKRTDKRQITVKAEDLEKIQQEAISTGRYPVFGFEVGGKHYVLEREGDYRERLEEIAELRQRLAGESHGEQ
jgi:Holliday junction resolvase